MSLLSYQQLQQAVLRDGRNGVFTHAQRDQRIHQRLSMHAHQMATIFRQLAAGKRQRQTFAQTFELHLGVRRQTQALKKMLHCPARLARHDVDQIACLPRMSTIRCPQPQQINPGTAAVRVEQLTLH